MPEPAFLSLEEILFIHQKEIQAAGGAPGIHDQEGFLACVEAPKASFGGEYLHDLFGMAASYIACLTMRHREQFYTSQYIIREHLKIPHELTYQHPPFPAYNIVVRKAAVVTYIFSNRFL